MSSKYTVPQPGSISSAGSAVDVTRLVMEAVRLQTEAMTQVMREQSEAAAEHTCVKVDERREASEARKKQEGATAAPATMALRMQASERGLRHSPAVRSSAPRTPAVCGSMHDCTDASKPQRGAVRGLSTEASAKTVSIVNDERQEGDDLDGQQPHDERPARLGGVQDATSIYVVAA